MYQVFFFFFGAGWPIFFLKYSKCRVEFFIIEKVPGGILIFFYVYNTIAKMLGGIFFFFFGAGFHVFLISKEHVFFYNIVMVLRWHYYFFFIYIYNKGAGWLFFFLLFI
jgi:hypothetical protein